MSVYLDHAATTPMADAAIAAMTSSLSKIGNPSSLHTQGRATRKDVEDAREVIAKAVGALPSEIIFTGSGTEADNAAIKGLFWKSGKKVIVISAVEHIAKRGNEIALISVMHSNNETGVIQPVGEVVKIAGDIPVHTDAVQSFTKTPLSYKELGVTSMALSAHKVGGPLGIGVLVLRRAFEIPALLHGGGQEREIRSGTLNAPSIVAFAAAVENSNYDSERVCALRDRFESGLRASVPDAYINGVDAPRLPGITNVTFPGTQSDSLLLLMDSEKVSCSTGAACSAGVHRPSHVLLAMGHTEVTAQSSLRFSCGATSTESDIDFALSVLPTVINRGRAAASK